MRLILIVLLATPGLLWANVDSLMVAASDTMRTFDDRVSLLKDAAKKDGSGRVAHALGDLFMVEGGKRHVHDAERWLKAAMISSLWRRAPVCRYSMASRAASWR